jgi:hypothetical protein
LCDALRHNMGANRCCDGSRRCGANYYCVEHKRESRETSGKKPETGRRWHCEQRPRIPPCGLIVISMQSGLSLRCCIRTS